MLRLRQRDVEELPEPPLADSPWKVMAIKHAAHAPQPSEVMELRRPGAPNDVVRLGPTVTQVAGFGPHAEVVAWLADAMIAPPHVIHADAFDDISDAHRRAEHLEPEDRQTLVDRVLDLA